jgi:hypothetical protein
VSGLELPFTGALHAQDPEWLLSNLRPAWSIVLTLIPGTMDRLGTDPTFGLASSVDSGRERAVQFVASAREAVKTLNARGGRARVVAVEIHSAPRPAPGVEPSADAFRRSLDTLRSWDWEGAALSVEHCDAHVAGQKPAKGFLSLADEIAAIRRSRGATPVGLAVNWGRSAIEGRSADTPRQHVEQARAAGVLNGLMFSGATVGDALYADWADMHAPFARNEQDKARLLTPARAAECRAAAKGAALAFAGFKIQTLPKDLSVPERVAELRRSARILDAAGES